MFIIIYNNIYILLTLNYYDLVKKYNKKNLTKSTNVLIILNKLGIDKVGFNPQIDKVGFNPQIDKVGFNPQIDKVGFNPQIDKVGFNPQIDKVSFNPQIPKHKGSKISLITDSLGIPINSNIFSANIYDF